MGLRRLVRDWIVRLSLAVFALDWIVVGWPTFFWLDLAAIVVMMLAMSMEWLQPTSKLQPEVIYAPTSRIRLDGTVADRFGLPGTRRNAE